MRPKSSIFMVAVPVSSWGRHSQAVRSAYLLTISLLTVTGCSAMTAITDSPPIFRLQQSTADARAQVASWVPIGVSLSDATRVLSSQGFTCNPTEPSTQTLRSSTLCLNAASMESIPEQRTTAPPTPVNWFITLDSEDGDSVSAVQVARTPKDIGG